MRISLELEKTVDQNASTYFEKAKKARKKTEGVKKMLIDAKEKLEKARKENEKEKQKSLVKEAEKQRKKSWFEKYRWFISSDGFLVIGGKDASSNEAVMKKHAEPDEIVFHTEAPGSPFMIIKNPEKKEIPQTTINEAAENAATYSKAWAQGIRSIEVMQFQADQASKEANAGEYISKGAFMIRGKRKIYDSTLNLGIGLLKDELKEEKNPATKIIMAGPETAIKKNCSEYVLIKQGGLKKGDLAKSIMHNFRMHTNDDIIAALPSGNSAIKKEK